MQRILNTDNTIPYFGMHPDPDYLVMSEEKLSITTSNLKQSKNTIPRYCKRKNKKYFGKQSLPAKSPS